MTSLWNRPLFASPAGALVWFFLFLSIGTCSTVSLVTVPTGQPEAILIRGVDVFTGVPDAPVLRGQDVLIRSGRIAEVGPKLQSPPGARVIDGAGRMLLPGFVDFHTHVRGGMIVPWKPLMLPTFAFNLEAALFSGIIAIVDLGGEDTASMRAYSRDIEQGRLLGPRLFTAGRPFTVSDGHPRRMGQLIRDSVPCVVRPFVPEIGDSISDGWEGLEQHLSAKPDFTKIVVDRIPLSAGLMSQDQLTEIVRRSHKRGVPAVVHVGASANLDAIVRAGADGAAHIVYKDEVSVELARRVAERKIFVVPTLVVWDNMHHLLARKSIDQFLPLEWESMHPARREALRNRGPLPRTDPDWLEFNDVVARGNPLIFKNTATLKKAGVRILVGTDSPNMGLGMGGSIHRELMLLVKAGLTPTEALISATSLPASVLGREAEFGSIAVGKSADLILVQGDPTKNITDTQRIEAVIYRGRLLSRQPPAP